MRFYLRTGTVAGEVVKCHCACDRVECIALLSNLPSCTAPSECILSKAGAHRKMFIDAFQRK